MKKIFVLLIVLTVQLGYANQNDSFFKKADQFFSTFVKNGKVDYKAIQSDPSSLNELVGLIESAEVNSSQVLDYQAFYINTYNLLVIKGIIANYPINSPLDIGGFFDKTKYIVAGNKLTLNDIENKVLRAEFPEEARFHFVLVCAGLGCPPIIDEAYKPSKLTEQLQRQTELALNDPNFIKVKGNKVQISQIFEWYKKDFTQKGSEIEFINKYREEKLPQGAKLSYYPYDWKLNDIK